MTTVNKVIEIQKLTNLLNQLDEASSAEYKMLKDVTDDFSDLDEEIFNPEITFIVDKLHEKIIKVSNSSKMDDIKEATSGSESVFDEGELPTAKPKAKDKPEPKAEFKVGDEVSIKSKSFTGRGVIISVELQEGMNFKYRVDSFGTQVSIYSKDKVMKLFKEKEAPKAEPKARKRGELRVGDKVSVIEKSDGGQGEDYEPDDLEGVIESIGKEGDETLYFVKTERGTFEFYEDDLIRIRPKDAPMLTPKVKAGQHIVFKHDVDSPNRNKPKTLKSFGIIKSVKFLSDEEGETAYTVHWADGDTDGMVYESHLTKISEKEYNEGIEKVKYAEANPKKVEPEYTGDSVFKETIEHKIVSRFLGLRAKNAPESLVLNAYTQLQKMITNQEVRKTNPHADLIRAIQGSYYNMLTKANVEKLVLSESLNAKAVYLFDNEKRYSSVKLMTEFAGWTGKSKTLKQIQLFVKKAENVLKEGKKTDPYHEELKEVMKSLSSAKEGQSIVPESVGLSGLGSLFAIKVVR